MKKYVLILTAIISTSNLFGQITEPELQSFVNDNKKKVENQIKHIREVYARFQNEKKSYTTYLLLSSLNNREENYLVDKSKISIKNIIGTEVYDDWIEIIKINADTFCASLDYSEYYIYNPSNPIVVISTVQGDYPEGFTGEIVDYYFFNNSLLFVYINREEDYYGYFDRYLIREERYYYLNNRPIRCLEKEINNRDDDINSTQNKPMDLSTGIEYYEKGLKLLNKMKIAKIYR